MSDLQDAIIHLIESPHYKELADYKPPFNLFDVMSVRYRELTHSSVLAWLLADETNTGFTRKFLDWIAAQDEIDNDTKRRIKFSSDYKFKDVDIRCEFGDSKHGRIDVFVRFRKLGLAIAIEVKIWAGEQEKQVDRYQEFLRENYHDDKKMVIFLTSLGYKPVSDVVEYIDVPVLTMSWDRIAEFIDEVNDSFDNPEDEYNFRKQFSQHIKRDIVMDTEEKRIVRELLSDEKNAETIRKIFHSLPPLTDYTDKWKEIVANVCETNKNSLEENIHRYRGQPLELKLVIPEWEKAGLPFELMLYKYENAAVRILLHKDKYKDGSQYKISLENFAANSDGVVEFKLLKDWTAWYSVLKIDDGEAERQETIFNLYSKDWERRAEDKLKMQMEKLLPLIQKWMSDHP